MWSSCYLFAFVNTALEFLEFIFILFSLFEVKCDHSLQIFKILLQSLLYEILIHCANNLKA